MLSRHNGTQVQDSLLKGLAMKSDKDAATLIQKTLHGIAVRSHTVIKQLPDDKLCSYRSFLIGNDNPLTAEHLGPHKINTNFVLIGTSLFRSIDIACTLAASEAVFPKVVIVDNSREAAIAWAKIKDFFQKSTKTSWRAFLFDNPDEDDPGGFLEFVLSELRDIRVDSDLVRFFTLFSKFHSLEYVRRVVAGVVMIQQDWSNIETFTTLRQIYKDRPIVAYPSNIIPYVDPPIQINVIKCIDTLKPCLSLCTNLDPYVRRPTKSYVFLDSSPATLIGALDLNPEVAAAFALKDFGMEDAGDDSGMDTDPSPSMGGGAGTAGA